MLNLSLSFPLFLYRLGGRSFERVGGIESLAVVVRNYVRFSFSPAHAYRVNTVVPVLSPPNEVV